MNYNPYFTQEEHTHHAHGVDGARNYPMANNSDGFILDDSSDMGFLKMVDAVGRVTLNAYRLVPVQIKTDDEKLNDINARLDKIEEMLKNGKSST